MNLAMERPDIARENCEAVPIASPTHDGCRMALLVIELGTRNYHVTRELLLNNPKVDDEESRHLATEIADALEGHGDRITVARQLLAMPYHAVFDPGYPGTMHDSALPALLLALDEPDIALQRFVSNADNEPKDALVVIWDPMLDAIRCDPSFVSTVTELNVVDWRAVKVCQQ